MKNSINKIEIPKFIYKFIKFLSYKLDYKYCCYKDYPKFHSPDVWFSLKCGYCGVWKTFRKNPATKEQKQIYAKMIEDERQNQRIFI